MDFMKLGDLLKQDYLAIPDYQRDYEWGNSQNETLIEDIFEMVKDPTAGNHFFGAIVTIPFEEDCATNCCINFSDYEITTDSIKHIVDGQQRLTSISILLQATMDCIEEDQVLLPKDKERNKQKFATFLKGSDSSIITDDLAPRLFLNGNTGHYYNSEILKLNDRTPSDRRYSGAKRVYKAYMLFREAIEQQKNQMLEERNGINSTADFYKVLIEVLTKRIRFVEIECSESSNAFQVFDSLNGKGLDLTAADRIKNIVLSWSPKGKGAQHWDAITGLVGEKYLGNFFSSLLFYSVEKRVSKNKLPEEFKGVYKNSATESYDNFHFDLKEKAKPYGMIREYRTPNKEVNCLLEDIRQLKFEQVYVLIFAVLIQYGESVINEKAFSELLKKILTMIVRIQVCEKSTNRLDSIFSTCIKRMKADDVSLDEIITILDTNIQQIAKNEEFVESFKRFTVSDNAIAEYYLRQLENYLRVKNGNRSAVERNLTVEHIIPSVLDTPEDWYGEEPVPDEVRVDFKNELTERIANKMLLYRDDNSSAGNNDYVHKKAVYQKGKRGQKQGTPVDTFELVKELLNRYPDKFNHEELNNRAEILAGYAVEIWK